MKTAERVVESAGGAGGETGAGGEPVEGIVHGDGDPAKIGDEYGVSGGAAAVD
uniref:Uncharacterized protein n=1 Tax=Arundo donax TaxID=35708 RepID=A0A0A8ZGC8_ARUDO